MIEKIENNQVPDILKESSAMQPSPSNTPAETGLGASLQISYDSLIEQVKQIPPEDASVIQRARELLLSGQLDSPENIRAAAEAIVKFGIQKPGEEYYIARLATEGQINRLKGVYKLGEEM